MPKVAYSTAQKAEAVALATVIGSEAAGQQLGITPRAIRGWAERAGKTPADSVSTSSWQSLLDLAMARVGSALAGGTVRPKDAAVIAGIAARNIREPKPEEPRTPEQDAYDAFVAELEARYPDPDQEHLAVVALLRHHHGHGCMADDQGNYPPCPDPIPDAWAYLESLGDLEAWRAAADARQRAAMDHWQRRRQEVRAEWEQRSLDDETRALLAAAEAYLAETVEEPDAA